MRPPLPRLALLALAVAVPLPGTAAVIDVPSGDVGALKQGITMANATPGPDTIVLHPGTYALMSVDNGDPNGPNGLPVITSDITINGNGATIARTGGPQFRIFFVQAGGALTLNDLTVTGGDVSGVGRVGGNIEVFGNDTTLTLNCTTLTQGGALFGGGLNIDGERAHVTLNGSAVVSNRTRGGTTGGGGIAVLGGFEEVTLDHSVLSDNEASASSGNLVVGGGMAVEGGDDQIVIRDTTVDGNRALATGGVVALGGGVVDDGADTYMIERSTFSNNRVQAEMAKAKGGGFLDEGTSTVTIRDSTFSGNQVSSQQSAVGGGVHSDAAGTFVLNNVTITNNSAGDGGGLANTAQGPTIPPGTVAIRNSLLGGNSAVTGPDCTGPIGSQGHNLFGDTSGCAITLGTGDLTGPPGIDPLADNGGDTETHALQVTSMALDHGDPGTPTGAGTTCEPTDQRGVARPQGPACDIGAFEVSATRPGKTMVCPFAISIPPTTVTSTTTTTTLPGGCGVPAPTFESIDCRLESLIQQVQNATDLGKLKNTMLKSLTHARDQKRLAESLVPKKNKLAKKRLKEAVRGMITFNFRVRSLIARKKIPAPTRRSLGDQGMPIQKDMQMLLKSLPKR